MDKLFLRNLFTNFADIYRQINVVVCTGYVISLLFFFFNLRLTFQFHFPLRPRRGLNAVVYSLIDRSDKFS